MQKREKERAFNIKLPVQTHRDLKFLSVEINSSMGEICRQAIDEFISKMKNQVNQKNKKA